MGLLGYALSDDAMFHRLVYLVGMLLLFVVCVLLIVAVILVVRGGDITQIITNWTPRPGR